MDKELLIKNIMFYCDRKNMPCTKACVEAGVGKDFIGDIRRGKTPSVAKVANLASFLGVTTSLLIGETGQDPPSELSEAWEQLNEEGRIRLVDYAEDLVASRRYIKTASSLAKDVG